MRRCNSILTRGKVACMRLRTVCRSIRNHPFFVFPQMCANQDTVTCENGIVAVSISPPAPLSSRTLLGRPASRGRITAQILPQHVQARHPESLHVRQPASQFAKAHRVQTIKSLLAAAPHVHQTCLAQDAQVVRNGRRAHRKPPGKVAGRDLPRLQRLYNLPAGWIGQRRKSTPCHSFHR